MTTDDTDFSWDEGDTGGVHVEGVGVIGLITLTADGGGGLCNLCTITFCDGGGGVGAGGGGGGGAATDWGWRMMIVFAPVPCCCAVCATNTVCVWP